MLIRTCGCGCDPQSVCCFGELQSSARQIRDAAFCRDIEDMVKSMSHEHRIEVKMAILTIPGADRDKPGSVKLALEGVIASMSALYAKEAKDSKRQVLSASKAAEQTQMLPIADVLSLSAAAAFQRGNGNRGNGNFPNPCDDCGGTRGHAMLSFLQMARKSQVGQRSLLNSRPASPRALMTSRGSDALLTALRPLLTPHPELGLRELCQCSRSLPFSVHSLVVS